MTNLNNPFSHNWFPDSSATHHVTPDFTALSQVDDYHGTDHLHVGSGKPLPILHTCSSFIPNKSRQFTLPNVLHGPSLSKSLLSVQQFTKDNNVFFEFHPSHFCVKDQVTKQTLLTGPSKDGLYSFSSVPPSVSLTEKASSECWHHRLGHPHF